MDYNLTSTVTSLSVFIINNIKEKYNIIIQTNYLILINFFFLMQNIILYYIIFYIT